MRGLGRRARDVTAVILRADARALPLPDASVDLIVTSTPYSDANAVEFLRPQVAHLKSRRYVWMPPGSPAAGPLSR